MEHIITKPRACAEVDVRHNANDNGLIITAAVPGIEKKDLELIMGKEHFCLSGERDDLRYDGCYQLFHEVEVEQSVAKFVNGLLTVEVPFKEPLRGKKIEIH